MLISDRYELACENRTSVWQRRWRFRLGRRFNTPTGWLKENGQADETCPYEGAQGQVLSEG